jgi:hypothetical protein
MDRLHRSAFVVAVVLALAPNVHRAWQDPDVRKLPAWLAALEQERENEQTLLDRLDVVRGQVALKERAACDVAEGRLSLLEAAARFRDLDAACAAAPMDYLRQTNPHVSDEERYCSQVIFRVREVLRKGLVCRPGVAEELEAEFRRLRHDGTLTFPARTPAEGTGKPVGATGAREGPPGSSPDGASEADPGPDGGGLV